MTTSRPAKPSGTCQIQPLEEKSSKALETIIAIPDRFGNPHPLSGATDYNKAQVYTEVLGKMPSLVATKALMTRFVAASDSLRTLAPMDGIGISRADAWRTGTMEALASPTMQTELVKLPLDDCKDVAALKTFVEDLNAAGTPILSNKIFSALPPVKKFLKAERSCSIS